MVAMAIHRSSLISFSLPIWDNPVSYWPTNNKAGQRMRGEGGRVESWGRSGDEREREKMPKPILLEEVQDIPPRPDNMTKSFLRFPKSIVSELPASRQLASRLQNWIIVKRPAPFAAHLINRGRMSDRGQQKEEMGSRPGRWREQWIVGKLDAETSDLQHASGGERIKVISSISSSEASIIIDELNRVLRFGFIDVFVVGSTTCTYHMERNPGRGLDLYNQ